MQPVQHAPDAARGLAAAVSQDAIMGAPEFVFVEAPPHRVLFDMKHKCRGVLFELDNVLLDDRWNAVAAGSHSRAIDLISAVHQCDGSDHRAGILGIKMKLFTHGIE